MTIFYSAAITLRCSEHIDLFSERIMTNNNLS